MEKKDIAKLWNDIIRAAQIHAKIENDNNSLEWINELRNDITDYFKDKTPKEEFIYIVSFFRTVYKFNFDTFLKSNNDFKEMDFDIEITKLEQKRILANLSDIKKTPKLDLYIEYLKNTKKITGIQPEPPGAGENTEPENPHPRIFPNGKCWQLFEHWRNEVKERTQLAELSFIYWQMQKDGLIDENIKPTEFRKWLLKTFDIDLDELKQLDNCKGGNKYPRYQTAKLLFKC